MTTAPIGRLYTPSDTFVSRGRWTYTSSLIRLRAFDSYAAFFVDIPSLTAEQKIDFSSFEEMLSAQILVSEQDISVGIRQGVSLLKGYVVEHLERNGIYLDVRSSFGLICVCNGVLYGGGLGRVSIGIFRDDQYYTLLTAHDSEVQTVSGFLKEEDYISLYVEGYPIEELCVQVVMEEEATDHVYLAYLSTFPSRGAATLLHIHANDTQDEDVAFASNEKLEEHVDQDSLQLEGVDEEDLSLDTIESVDAEINGRRYGVVAIVARMILKVGSGLGQILGRLSELVRMVLYPVVHVMQHTVLVYIGIFLFLMTGIVVIAGQPYEEIWQQAKSLDAAKAAQLPPLQEQLKEIQTLGTSSPVRANRMLMSLRDQVLNLPADIKDSSEGKELVSAVEDLYAEGIKAVQADVQLFFDVSTVGEGATVGKMTVNQDAMLVGDVIKDAVYRVDLTTRASRALLGKGDGVEDLLGVVADNSQVFAVARSGVFATGFSSAEVKKSLEKDSKWQSVQEGALFNNAVYLLDAGASQVWKYGVQSMSLGSGSSYISSNAQYSLSDSVDVSIDGYVWIGLRNGNVVRLAQGSIDSFTLESLPNQLSTLTAVATPLEHEFLYVLDNEVGRVVQYRKETGGFVQQFMSERLVGAKDLAVDPASKTVYFGKENFIYRFSLQ